MAFAWQRDRAKQTQPQAQAQPQVALVDVVPTGAGKSEPLGKPSLAAVLRYDPLRFCANSPTNPSPLFRLKTPDGRYLAVNDQGYPYFTYVKSEARCFMPTSAKLEMTGRNLEAERMS